ncbi:RsmE family RNA methyltransferase [Trichloromonas sp.]|uniref:RsmE family RNA methyltransferase n=1 Tax=Trichloromonas sp. TaxID=3069249 RepID=UPI003D817DA4
MNRPCVNRGGRGSIIRVPGTVQLEQATPLPPEAVAALACWEPRAGEIFTLVDSCRMFYRARLAELGPQQATVVPFQHFVQPPESPVEIVVYQALPEKERFELILQKLTETGVCRIVPYASSRSITLDERDAGQKKSHRWPEVLLRAARQCRRAMIPELAPVLGWDEMLKEAAAADLRLMFYEGETCWTFKEAIRGQRPDRVALLVGPEGGFDAAEAAQAQAAGVLPVSLGGRILRTETAAILGAAMIQFSLGDLG